MIWRYEARKTKNGWGISEVFYEGKKKLGWTEEITLDCFESKKELVESLEMMLEDLSKE